MQNLVNNIVAISWGFVFCVTLAFVILVMGGEHERQTNHNHKSEMAKEFASLGKILSKEFKFIIETLPIGIALSFLTEAPRNAQSLILQLVFKCWAPLVSLVWLEDLFALTSQEDFKFSKSNLYLPLIFSLFLGTYFTNIADILTKLSTNWIWLILLPLLSLVYFAYKYNHMNKKK